MIIFGYCYKFGGLKCKKLSQYGFTFPLFRLSHFSLCSRFQPLMTSLNAQLRYLGTGKGTFHSASFAISFLFLAITCFRTFPRFSSQSFSFFAQSSTLVTCRATRACHFRIQPHSNSSRWPEILLFLYFFFFLFCQAIRPSLL